MKNLFLLSFSLLVVNSFAQVLSNNTVTNGFTTENPFLDASSNFDPTLSGSNTNGKGLLFPATNLVNWVFSSLSLDGTLFPRVYDGMIVYNIGTGNTPTTGNNSSTVTAVTPGFYFYSNPTGSSTLSVTAGRWLPLGGGSGVKSKTVTVVVPANPTTATLALGTGTITANEVVTYLGAKVYDSTGANLVMTADSAYDKATNLLTTGNGFAYQVLPAGTYQVVVEYR
jgi:hypothetical protein